MLQETGHIKNANALIFRHVQCLRLTYAQVAWVVGTRTQIQPQVKLYPDYPPGYLSVSYDYD